MLVLGGLFNYTELSMTKKLLFILAGFLLLSLCVSALTPSHTVAHNEGEDDHSDFSISLIKGVATESIPPGGTVIYGPGTEDSLRGRRGRATPRLGSAQEGDIQQGYYAYTREEGNNLVYISILGDKCGNELHVPRQEVYEELVNGGNGSTQSMKIKWYNVNSSLDGTRQLECTRIGTGTDVYLAFGSDRVALEGIGTPDEDNALFDGSIPRAALNNTFTVGAINSSTLTARGGNNYDLETKLFVWKNSDPDGTTHIYREIRSPGDDGNDDDIDQCGSEIHVQNLDPNNPGEAQLLVGVWYDVHDDDNLNCNSIDGDNDNERQIFLVNYTFSNDSYLQSSHGELARYWSVDTTGENPVLTEHPDGTDQPNSTEYIYLGEHGTSIFFEGQGCTPVIQIEKEAKDSVRLVIYGKKYTQLGLQGQRGPQAGRGQTLGIHANTGSACDSKRYGEPGLVNIVLISEDTDGILDNLPVGSGTGGSGTGRAETCEGNVENLGFGWILCPALSLASRALAKMEVEIEGLLRVDVDDPTSQVAYKKMWGSLRDLATFAIVGTALFMVISTAINAGFFSNYTVKKYLPRLIMGVILIQLSYGLFTGFLEITNELGDGVNQLLETAYNGGADWNLNEIAGATTPSASGGLTFAVGGVVAGFLIGGLGALGALSVLYSAAIALLFGFLFLILREFIILSLVIFSPIGLALWILPGNDKAWRLYIKTFLTLVFMYPLIVAVIALGKIFSQITASGGINGEPVKFVISLLAYIGGYAAIPFMAKRFSGALGQLTGTLNDKSKGIFDKGKNKIEGYKKVRKEVKDGAKTRKMLTWGATNDKGSGALDRLRHHRGQYARSKRRLQTGRRVTGREGLVDGTKNVIAGAREGYTAARAQGFSRTEAAGQAANERRGRKREGLSDLTNLRSPKRDMRRASMEKRDIMSALPAERQKLVEEQVAQDDSRLRNETYEDRPGHVVSLYEARGAPGNPGELARQAVAETSRTRIEAMGQRMLAVGDENAFGHFAAHAIDPGSSQEHKEAIGSLIASGKVAEAFGDKAPDIGKMSSTAFAPALLEKPSIEKLEKLSAEAIGRAHTHLGADFGDQYGKLVSPHEELGEKNWGKLSPPAQEAIEAALGVRPGRRFDSATGTFVPPVAPWP